MADQVADVVVVGAGVIGSTLARELQLLGASVLLVDAGKPGFGTSGATFAWFNASAKIRLRYPDPYFELNKTAVARCYRLANALRDGTWLHPIGNIEVATREETANQLRADVSEMLRRGYPAYLLDPKSIREIEPALPLPSESVAAFYPEEGWIDGPQLVHSAIQELRAKGGRVIEGDGVVRFKVAGGRVAEARLKSGATVEADCFVIAAGIDTMKLAALAGVHVPLLEPNSPQVAGLLVRCDWEGSADRLHRIVHFDGLAVRPDRHLQVLVAGTNDAAEVTVDTAPETLSRIADGLLHTARRSVPCLSAARVSSAFRGLRAIPIDRLPVVGWTPAVDNVYIVVTHSGITLAAYFAELGASEITSRAAEAILEPYRPGRFPMSTRSS